MIGRIEYQTADGVDTEHVITLPAPGTGQHWVVLILGIIYEGTPDAGDITITGLDDVTAFPLLISGGNDKDFAASGNFFLGLDNTAVVITTPAGGTGVRSLVSVTAVKLLAANLERLYFQS